MVEFKVFVTRRLPGTGLDRLKTIADVEVNPEDRVLSRDELMDGVSGKDGVLTLLTDHIDAHVMDSNPHLRVISNYAVGFDNIDLPAATARGIYVTNTPDVLTETVADLTWALILGTARRLVEGDRYLRSGRWRGWAPTLLLGNDVYGKSLGIIGLGRIGASVARRAVGFGMRILYHQRTRNVQMERALGLTYMSLEELLETADYVTLHVPLSSSTYHMIGGEELDLMKPTAYLINTSRGPVVDEKALIQHLKNGAIVGAGLDVFETEPIDRGNPLMDLERVLLVPHVGSGTIETRTAMADLAVENLMLALRGEMPPCLVNRDVIKVRPLE